MKRLFIIMLLFSSLSYANDIKVIIDIKGMSCSLCVTSINQSLRKTDGVIKAKASLKTRQAEVIVPDGYELSKLLASITKTGYTGVINQVIPLQHSPSANK